MTRGEQEWRPIPTTRGSPVCGSRVDEGGFAGRSVWPRVQAACPPDPIWALTPLWPVVFFHQSPNPGASLSPLQNL